MYLYFSSMGIIFQVDISQRVDWFATCHTHANTVDQRKLYFLWYPIFYTLYLTLYVFRMLALVDESNTYSCLPMPPRAAMTNGGNEPCSTSKIRSLYCFVCFSEFLTSIPPDGWVEYPYIKKSPLARNPEPSGSNIYAFRYHFFINKEKHITSANNL